MAEGGGLATVLRLMRASGEKGGAAAQEDFFEAEDAPMPLAPARGRSGPQGGRPQGARNRSTEEWVRYFLAQHRSPLMALGAIYTRPLEELVDELQRIADKNPVVTTDKDGVITRTAVRINPLDVLKLQMQAADAIKPYIHKQQPKAIEVEQRQRGLMIIDNSVEDAAPGADDDAQALPLPPLKNQ